MEEPHARQTDAGGLADSLRCLADSLSDSTENRFHPQPGALGCARRMPARYSVGVMPKRWRNARLNGPIDP